MNLKLNYISQALAKKIGDYLNLYGLPSENRFLVLSPKDEFKTSGGIIVPGNAKEGIPRKGVIIQKGVLTEPDVPVQVREFLQEGNIITYGLYAGKEVEFDVDAMGLTIEEKLQVEKSAFTVLSYSEIIYIEINK
jgi:co-chaperonin GroES (HSP10)